LDLPFVYKGLMEVGKITIFILVVLDYNNGKSKGRGFGVGKYRMLIDFNLAAVAGLGNGVFDISPGRPDFPALPLSFYLQGGPR
jgi:hypothetical protein